MSNDKPNTIFDNLLALDCFCIDVIEQAEAFYEKNPKRRGDMSVRERAEFWIENDLIPCLENTIEDTFESEESDDD